MQGGDRENRQKVEGKEKGKAAIPGQGLQAAFPVKPFGVRYASVIFLPPKHLLVNSVLVWPIAYSRIDSQAAWAQVPVYGQEFGDVE